MYFYVFTIEGMLFSVCLSVCPWLFTTSLWTYKPLFGI